MPLESGTYISDLDTANPTYLDGVSQGDDHLRLLKSTIKATLPNLTGAVTGTHTQLNNVVARIGNSTTAAEARTALGVPSTAEAALLYPAPNLIDNSNFSINQRAVSGTVTLAAGAYGHDRFKGGASGCTYTFAASGGIATVTISAGSLVQVVEGENLETATYTLAQGGTAQMRIVGGSYAAGPIAVSATAGTNLNLEFGTGTVKQVKLEKGSAATAWVMPTGQTDLLNCQRYCQRYTMPPLKGHVITTSSIGRMAMVLPVTMRAVPTATIIGTLGAYDGTTVTTVSSITNSYNTVSSVEFDMAVAGTLLTVGRAASIYNNSGNGAILLVSDL